MSLSLDPASFRDPSGFVFYREEILLRQVQRRYSSHYDHLMSSGLYGALAEAGMLIPHTEDPLRYAVTEDAYRILRPERIPFVSYPYEWSFSQLQDAALATLQIQQEALKAGMTLKDASAYNIQFKSSRPVLIDTLSFEIYEEGQPWTAYSQFCRHFLAPLALMSKVDIRLSLLLRANIEGIPLDLASRLLSRSTWLNPGLLTHIHLHGAAQKRYEGDASEKTRSAGGVSRMAMRGILDSLETAVKRLAWNPAGTTWADYYEHTNYSDRAMGAKKSSVSELLDRVTPRPGLVWDLGANTGVFSRLASEQGAFTVAWDIDPAAVEKNYRECRDSKDTMLLPLVGDLTNPSPDLGWALRERRSVSARGPADVVMALALVHHLAIGNNVPLTMVAEFFATICKWAIVEFVPKSDSQVKRLLATREDIFDGYTLEGFEAAFYPLFEVVQSTPVADSDRVLYLMRARVN